MTRPVTWGGYTYTPPAPPPAPPMTVYDLLRKLVNAETWSEEERRNAATLISELERVGALGTMAGELTTDKGATPE